MGLENQIAELNKNIVVLIDTIKGSGVQAIGKMEIGLDSTKPVTEKVEAKGKPEPDPAATQEQKVEPAAVESEAPAATYEDVKNAILNLSKSKGRDAAVAVLDRHGVKKVPELGEDQYASVVDMANKTLAGELDPEEALV